MQITFKDSTNKVILKDCIELYEKGICIAVNDGKHITFEIEEETYQLYSK